MSVSDQDSSSLENWRSAITHGAENKYFRIGLGLTFTFVTAAAIYAIMVWPLILSMKPNELGDFLAGIFGPLALLWVVLGFLQQGVELRNSRSALLLQAEELKESVAAQRDMGKAAWEQVSVNRDGLMAARAREIEPSFLLRGGGGGSSGGSKHFDFVLSNQGAIAHKIEISASSEYLSLDPQYIAQLAENAEHRIRIEYPQIQVMTDFVFTVVAHDRHSEAHVWEYQILGNGGAQAVENMFGRKVPRP